MSINMAPPRSNDEREAEFEQIDFWAVPLLRKEFFAHLYAHKWRKTSQIIDGRTVERCAVCGVRRYEHLVLIIHTCRQCGHKEVGRELRYSIPHKQFTRRYTTVEPQCAR